MAIPCILIVDDQRDIIRLLHSALDTLGQELKVIEAPSGEEAILESTRHQIDLLVADYRLPGISGLELMHKIRARHPDVEVILITGLSDRKVREQLLNAGAAALFEKPIPLADFLDVVERCLGLSRTILPSEGGEEGDAQRKNLSALLANFRQDVGAQAVYLISDRGRVLARAGDLTDSSMEVSLLSSLMAIYSAGLKVSRFIHQEALSNYHIFADGDYDLMLIPVNNAHALLVAGSDLVKRDRILDTVDAMLAVRDAIEAALKSLGVAPVEPEAARVETAGRPAVLPANMPVPTEHLEELLTKARKRKLKREEVEAFWSEAVEKHTGPPANPDVLTYEQARQLGLAPEEKKKK